MKQKDFTSKVHLIISVVVVIPAAIIYGFNLDIFLDIQAETIDEKNFAKAVMGLYLGFSVLWIAGILKSGYLKLALVSNTIFMLCLAIGRVLSILIDGTPTTAYLVGTIGEMVLGLYGLWVLNTQYHSTTNP